MKENLEEDLSQSESPLNNLRKSLLRSTVHSRSESSLIDFKNPLDNSPVYKKRESDPSFERLLNDKYRKEQEEEKIKMEVKSKKNLLKKINKSIRKDYFLLFFLFLSSSFNFNYLFLPFIVIGGIYLTCIGNFKFRPMRLKYLLEIFVIGYTSYLLIFKVIIYSLIRNEDETINTIYKDFFIDLGICILKDRDSNFYFIMNFLPEVLIISVSGYGILISFRSRLLTPKDLKVKTITNFKLSKYTLIIYVLMVVCTLFNLSYLSLFYIICIQIILFLCSIKFRENAIKKILKFMIYLIIILFSLQIIILNILNIHSIKKELLEENLSSGIKKYIISKQIGINIINESGGAVSIATNFIGYLFSLIDLIVLINTCSKLALESRSVQNSENIENKNDNQEEKINKLVFKKSIFHKIINNIVRFLYHPVFNFEISRIFSIIWTYYYRNIFSLGILIFVFISFFSPHTKRNKCLVIFILSPMLTLSLCFFHISNIPGYFENMTDLEKLGYSSLGLKKYDNNYIEYPIGHLFFIIVMFLINSLYTAEASLELNLYNYSLNQSDGNKLVEMQDLSKINKLEEAILPKEEDEQEVKIKKFRTVSESKSGSINDSDGNDSDRNTLISSDSSQKDINRSNTNKTKKNINININYLKPKDINVTNDDENSVVSLIKKTLLEHIDNITLIVMYFVSVNAVNLKHIILVLIFILLIISPSILNYIYKANIILFQVIYIIEFAVDLFKQKYNDEFKKHKSLLEFFIVYNEDINSNDIEIFTYAVIYCFYFKYRTCNIESNKNLLNNKKISFSGLIKNKLKNHGNIQSIIFKIQLVFSHAYLWFLIGLFIFLNSYFEINFLFGLKLIIFLLCCLQFIFLFQSISPLHSDTKCFKILNRIFLFYCCINTLIVYLYQFLCKDFLSIKDSIQKKREENNFFMLNLPNFGFTLYKSENLYYNFLPHFLTTFVSVLFINHAEYILNNFIFATSQRRVTMSHLARERMKKKKLEQERMNKIRNELNEFIQDKMYADKYTENFNEIKARSKKLFRIKIIIIFSQFYWLGLFFSFGIIFNNYDTSFFMLFYAIIFGIFSMKMFHRIITKLTNYIKEKSYYISKVIRYSIVEKPKNRELNRQYRISIFKSLVILSFVYFILIYFYGIFDIYQHGCNTDIFKGCEHSFSQIFSTDNETDIYHDSTEAKIKSYALLFGFYFNTRKEKILNFSIAHLILTLLIIFDVYNQKLDVHYSDLKETLHNEIQELVNENNILQKYADIEDLNILIKIGLAVEGIDLGGDSSGDQDTPNKKISLKEKFRKVKTMQTDYNSSDDKLPLVNKESESLEESSKSIQNVELIKKDLNNEINNDEDDDDDVPLQVDEPMSPILENYDLNEKDPSNNFLKNNYLKKFISIIKKSNENEQELSVCNTRERIIQFVKRLIEQIIMFISLCLALSKLNIWTFIYLSITITMIFTKKTMYRFYLLYCFIFCGLTVQSTFFILNLNQKSSIKTEDISIYNVTTQALNIPIYKSIFNLTEEQGFFFGLGVSQYQVSNIILEFIQIILLYIYMNIFSYSIFQNIVNLGESSVSDDRKFDLNSLNLDQGSILLIKSTTEVEFLQYKECLSCYDFDIGETLEDFFSLLKLDNTNITEENPFGTKKNLKLNLKEIKNPALKELIEYRMLIKDIKDNMGKKEAKKYKPLPKYLIVLQKILYLYFHCFLLILMIMISMMTAGIFSAVYFSACFYYLIKSDSIYLGQEYTYPKAIKKTLRIIVLVDIIIQGIYQTPFFIMKENDIRYKLLSALGFIKVVDLNNNEIDAKSKLDIYGKAIIYFFMSVQHFIFVSKYFKRYYLAYLLENKFKTNKKSLINTFTFNNDRIQIYQKSLSIRQKTMEAMDDLKKIVLELNEKLNQMSESIFSKVNNNEIIKNNIEEKYILKNTLNEINNINRRISADEKTIKRPNIDENINNKKFIDSNKNIDNIINNKNIPINNQEKSDKTNLQKGLKEVFLDTYKFHNKPKIDLEPDEIKEKIESLIYNRFLTKIYIWFSKTFPNYKSVEGNAKMDFGIETIKGETKIKSIIETDLSRALSIIDLTGLDKNDMKKIKELIECNFDNKMKEKLEEKKYKEKRALTYKNKFRKFGNNLLKLNKFAKRMLSFDNTNEAKNEIKIQNNGELLELFRIQSEKEKEQKDKEESKEKKIEHIEELFETTLFKRYLKTGYLIEHILLHIQALFINNFTWICYFFMILSHMMSSSLITLIYPLSIFCYALLEYPRPKKNYWIACLVYTMIIMFIKFIIQLKLVHIFITEDTYTEIIEQIYYYRIGFRYYRSMFSKGFIKYILFDILVILSICINRNLLLTEGLWFKREDEIENIYQASERVAIYKNKKYKNTIEAVKDLLIKYIYTPKEIINSRKLLGLSNEIIDNTRHQFPFFEEKKLKPEYDEAHKSYFKRIFTKTRNEKPGKDFYAAYTIVMFLLCVYILIFFTKMDQDETYGTVNLDTTQFSGVMVIYLIFHVLIIAYDRIIFVTQNRDNLRYEYYFYKKNPKNGQGELITEKQLSKLKSEISKNNSNLRFDNISWKEIDILEKEYNIFFIQKENFNKTLLNKYILHLITTLSCHAMVFFYFPMRGNENLGNGPFCIEGENNTCNNFRDNIYIIFFYILYLLYLILSALQVKYGFYDIKRKSLFKKKDDELFSSMGSLFRAIPFLNEIKNALDWACTTTCLTLFQWNKFEAIYDTIFDTYCDKSDWDDKPIGEKIGLNKKISLGGSLAFILILILILPLILFSSLNPTNKLNNLTAAKITVDLTFNYINGAIKNYNLFENTRADSINEMFRNDDDTIWEQYNYSKSVQTRNFNHDQVQRVIFSENSDRNWDLARPHIRNLIQLLDLSQENDISSIELTIGYELTRPLPAEAQTCSDNFKVEIFKKGDDIYTSKGALILQDLRNALANCTDMEINIENAYSPPLRLTSAIDVNEIIDETYFIKKDVQLGFEGCSIENGNKNYFNSYFSIRSIENNSSTPLELHIFSDQISETTSGYSVLTFYISFVLLAGSYVREFLANEPEKIMLEEMPHPKKIVDLCEGIKISRYSYDLKSEEYLYTILIELMRSPDYLKLITDSSLDHFKLREELTEKNKFI